MTSAKAKGDVFHKIEIAMDGVGLYHRRASEIRCKKECWFSAVKRKVNIVLNMHTI